MYIHNVGIIILNMPIINNMWVEYTPAGLNPSLKLILFHHQWNTRVNILAPLSLIT